MRKAGIMGGTFDPIHIGHMIAAERAMEACGLDEMLFIPNAGPPLKDRAPGASPEDRWSMVRLAVQAHPRFRALDIELKRGGVSYTFDTVLQLQEEMPETEFHLIIGTDRIGDLPKWHRIGELAERIRFIGVDRPSDDGDPAASATAAAGRLPDKLGERLLLASMPRLAISSTAIRARLGAGLSVRYLVPEPALDYLLEKGLYRHDG
ncbi:MULTISPECIES: nicotinate-nucleotide adenylyltransferase [Paenibacillus]|uniref:nicotinate-nucleotide adenylyltransferase n=1 Tax=Paenibacillus TaxID=44249 RepID=UPI000418376B|nr:MULTISPECIES: nicotinate-nucleotide adenylyltransferase [Paenibacillus]KKC47126.1 nicotinic acid mononucleotide adenylyltransferase [Paenibacillus sp. D9]